MSSHIPTSNAKELGKIQIRRQNRDAANSSRRTVVGVDSETEDGNIFLVAAYDGRFLDHPNITFDNVCDLLLRYDEGYWVFFYNLRFDAECILKLLPEDILRKQYVRGGELKFQYGKYTIHYIEKKQLSIRKGRHVVICYDIMQYYDNKKLDVAYVENIKKPLDPKYLAVKSSRKAFSLNYYLRNKKRIREYCINDCILTKELAENWVDVFEKQFGFLPRNWISPGYCAEKVLVNNGVLSPYFHDIPYEVQELAWKAFYGGRFELIVRGFIGKCWLYDLNSAYPHALSTLPDLTKGKWISSDTMEPRAKVGFFHIAADIDDSVKISPFPFRAKDNRIVYQIGRFETYMTLEELRAVAGDNRIRFKILDSCQFIPYADCGFPFKQFIEFQYYRRLALKKGKDPLERAVKLILNSIYGKMAQRVNNRMGNLFNPVIASYITGFTRAQLYRFMRYYNLENYLVAFATDSIATREEITGLNSEKLGEMKLDKFADDVIFLSNGFYRFDGKWKQRGVGYDYEKKLDIEHQNTRISDDGQLYILVSGTRTTHIKSGILYNRLKSVGKIEEYEKRINLNSDRKRFWTSELKSLNEKTYCNSMPINATLVAKLIAKKSIILWKDENETAYEQESDL